MLSDTDLFAQKYSPKTFLILGLLQILLITNWIGISIWTKLGIDIKENGDLATLQSTYVLLDSWECL